MTSAQYYPAFGAIRKAYIRRLVATSPVKKYFDDFNWEVKMGKDDKKKLEADRKSLEEADKQTGYDIETNTVDEAKWNRLLDMTRRAMLHRKKDIAPDMPDEEYEVYARKLAEKELLKAFERAEERVKSGTMVMNDHKKKARFDFLDGYMTLLDDHDPVSRRPAERFVGVDPVTSDRARRIEERQANDILTNGTDSAKIKAADRDYLIKKAPMLRNKLRPWLNLVGTPDWDRLDERQKRKIFRHFPEYAHPDNPYYREFKNSGLSPEEFYADTVSAGRAERVGAIVEDKGAKIDAATALARRLKTQDTDMNNPPITQISYTPEQLDAMTPVQREEAEAYMRRTAPEMQEKHNEARAKQSKDSANSLMEGIMPSLTSQTDVSAQEFPDQPPEFASTREISDFIEDYFDQDHDEEYDQHQLELKLNNPPPKRSNSTENYAGKLEYASKEKNPYDTVNETMRAAGTPQPGYRTDMENARKSLLEQVSRKKKAVAQYAKASEKQRAKLKAEIADCDHKIRELSREAHMRLSENTPARNTRRKVPVRNDKGIVLRYDTETVPSGEPVPPTAPLTAEEEKFLSTMDEVKAKNEARPWDPKKPVPKDSWDDKMGRGPGGYVGDAAVPDLTEDQQKKLKSGELRPAKELREQKAKYEEEQKAKASEPPKDEPKKGDKS